MCTFVPALANWRELARRVTPHTDFPDIVQVTPRMHCKRGNCGRPLQEPRLRSWASHNQTFIYTEQGPKQGNSYALDCPRCKLHYFHYFIAPFGKWGNSTFQPWEFDDHQLGVPLFVLVNTCTAVTWEYLQALDIRMSRNPFQWINLALEYCDRFQSNGSRLSPKTVAAHLRQAWQWYILFKWRADLHKEGAVFPAIPNIRPPRDPAVHGHEWEEMTQNVISAHLPVFRNHFLREFAVDHHKTCLGADPQTCAQTVLIDGNAKLVRSICPASSGWSLTSRLVKREVSLPCGLRPRKGFHTCAAHAHRNVIISAPKLKFVPKKKFKIGRQCGRPQDCNTEKEFVGKKWHQTRGVLNAVFGCGVAASLKEMFGHESKTQVCLLMETLRESTQGRIKNFGYDDGCHLHETLEKAAREGNELAQQFLRECDIFIDAWHLRGHTRPSCKEKFNPADRAYGVRKNTEAAEQCWRYLNKHRHSLRYQSGPGFELHLLWVSRNRNYAHLSGLLKS